MGHNACGYRGTAALAECPQFKRAQPTVRKVVEHFRLVQGVGPIILGPGNRVMDGMLRGGPGVLRAAPTTMVAYHRVPWAS